MSNISGISSQFNDNTNPSGRASFNTTVSQIGFSWFTSSIGSGNYPMPPPYEQKQWASQIEQTASNNPQLQQALNANPQLLQALQNGTLPGWGDLGILFKITAPFANQSTFTPIEAFNFARGWVASAYNDFVSGYNPTGIETIKHSITESLDAMKKLIPPPEDLIEEMQKAKSLMNQVVYNPQKPEPEEFGLANTAVWKVFLALETQI